jgi:ribulose-5-phosphate 4-epimerase/fuculose-1-phosphate aldolase
LYDAQVLQANNPLFLIFAGFSELFIHSEIYKAHPNVLAVVHSHSLDVVPFSISSIPLQACFHMAGFLGTGVPIWAAATVYKDHPEDNQDMLVRI